MVTYIISLPRIRQDLHRQIAKPEPVPTRPERKLSLIGTHVGLARKESGGFPSLFISDVYIDIFKVTTTEHWK